MKILKWTTRKEEMELESKIADRYLKSLRTLGIAKELHPDKMELVLDIDACHCNGCPLKLQELLNAENVDFAHDISGIRFNINRKTGKLENCFDPRYSLNG